MTLDQLDLFYHKANSAQSKYSEEGVVFTPIIEAEKLIRSIFSKLPKSGLIKILEPSSGTGNLVLATIKVLKSKGINPKRVQIVSCELNKEYLNLQKAFIRENLHAWEKSVIYSPGDYLASFSSVEQFDFVIMNPPWVGYRNISAKDKFYIKREFDLTGQFDLLDPFVLKSFKLLKKNGRMGLFLPDKVMSSHQPSNSIEIIKPFCSRFEHKLLNKNFFFGVQHESVFISLEKSENVALLVKSKASHTKTTKIEDFFNLFRGFEISGRSSEYLVSDQTKALDQSRPFVSGQEIENGALNLDSKRYISKKVPTSLIKDQFAYTGPAVLVRKTGSPVRIAYVDKLPHVSQVVFVIVPKEVNAQTSRALKELALYLQSDKGQKQLAKNSGKLGRSLFPYITISDIKNVILEQSFVTALSDRKVA